MIKFFRKIRQSLLHQGKTGKYLTYALGEVVLVVIGILIALQINNWNEKKKMIKSEYEVMINLTEDLKINLSNLETSINMVYPEFKAHGANVIACFGLKEHQLTRDMKRNISLTWHPSTDIIDGSLNSILNSDKLELIQDNKLKNKLTAFPAQIAKFRVKEKHLERYVLEVQRDIFRNYVAIADGLDEDNPIRLATVESNYEGLMNNLYYQNIIVGQSIVIHAIEEEAINLQRATQEIYDLLSMNIEANPNHLTLKR